MVQELYLDISLTVSAGTGTKEQPFSLSALNSYLATRNNYDLVVYTRGIQTTKSVITLTAKSGSIVFTRDTSKAIPYWIFQALQINNSNLLNVRFSRMLVALNSAESLIKVDSGESTTAIDNCLVQTYDANANVFVEANSINSSKLIECFNTFLTNQDSTYIKSSGKFLIESSNSMYNGFQAPASAKVCLLGDSSVWNLYNCFYSSKITLSTGGTRNLLGNARLASGNLQGQGPLSRGDITFIYPTANDEITDARDLIESKFNQYAEKDIFALTRLSPYDYGCASRNRESHTWVVSVGGDYQTEATGDGYTEGVTPSVTVMGWVGAIYKFNDNMIIELTNYDSNPNQQVGYMGVPSLLTSPGGSMPYGNGSVTFRPKERKRLRWGSFIYYMMTENSSRSNITMNMENMEFSNKAFPGSESSTKLTIKYFNCVFAQSGRAPNSNTATLEEYYHCTFYYANTGMTDANGNDRYIFRNNARLYNCIIADDLGYIGLNSNTKIYNSVIACPVALHNSAEMVDCVTSTDIDSIAFVNKPYVDCGGFAADFQILETSIARNIGIQVGGVKCLRDCEGKLRTAYDAGAFTYSYAEEVEDVIYCSNQDPTVDSMNPNLLVGDGTQLNPYNFNSLRKRMNGAVLSRPLRVKFLGVQQFGASTWLNLSIFYGARHCPLILDGFQAVVDTDVALSGLVIKTESHQAPVYLENCHISVYGNTNGSIVWNCGFGDVSSHHKVKNSILQYSAVQNPVVTHNSFGNAGNNAKKMSVEQSTIISNLFITNFGSSWHTVSNSVVRCVGGPPIDGVGDASRFKMQDTLYEGNTTGNGTYTNCKYGTIYTTLPSPSLNASNYLPTNQDYIALGTPNSMQYDITGKKRTNSVQSRFDAGAVTAINLEANTGFTSKAVSFIGLTEIGKDFLNRVHNSQSSAFAFKIKGYFTSTNGYIRSSPSEAIPFSQLDRQECLISISSLSNDTLQIGSYVSPSTNAISTEISSTDVSLVVKKWVARIQRDLGNAVSIVKTSLGVNLKLAASLSLTVLSSGSGISVTNIRSRSALETIPATLLCNCEYVNNELVIKIKPTDSIPYGEVNLVATVVSSPIASELGDYVIAKWRLPMTINGTHVLKLRL